MSDDQPSLFDQPEAHARGSDPATSHAAAASLKPDKLRVSQKAVLDVMRHRGPMDDTRLVREYQSWAGVGSDQCPRQSESGIRTRRRELVDRGLVVDTGHRVTLPSGRKANVWAARTW